MRVGFVGVGLAERGDGDGDDGVVVERKVGGVVDGDEADVVAAGEGGGEAGPGDDVEVGDGDHPAAVVPAGIVEHVQLLR